MFSKSPEIFTVDQKEKKQILEIIKQIPAQTYFQNTEGEHKEKATCVSDRIEG